MSPEGDPRYPPDVVLDFSNRPGSFSWACGLLVLLAAGLDVLLFGFPDTSIPYNYPFFGVIVLLLLVVAFLRRTYDIAHGVVEELASIAERNRGDPLSRTAGVDPDAIRTELGNVLFLGFHPAVLLVGALAGGSLVFGIMWALGVFSAYPFLLLDFGFGAAHGVFFGPAIAMVYVSMRALREYIVDVDLMDPDGVGGYRQIGDGIVTISTTAILLLTLDFIVLSSVGFTSFTEFRAVVAGAFVLTLLVVLGGTVLVTALVRRRLMEIRDERIDHMQRFFTQWEHAYWNRQLEGEANLTAAVNLLAMYSMFHQVNRMNMWPINVVALAKLGLSVSFSIGVLVVENTGFLL
jgi:hypothetical protein